MENGGCRAISYFSFPFYDTRAQIKSKSERAAGEEAGRAGRKVEIDKQRNVAAIRHVAVFDSPRSVLRSVDRERVYGPREIGTL